VCDDLAAIGKPVPDHKKTFWLISGLGKGYEMFTTTMLRPSIPPYSEILVLLEAHTECFKLDHANTSTNQMAFMGQRANNHNYKGRKKNGPTSFNSKGKRLYPRSILWVKALEFQSYTC
jgi:hypothetical protein